MMAALTIGGPEGEHGVRVRTPLGPGGDTNWYATEQKAREKFNKAVASLRNESKGPGLFKLQHIEQRSVVDEELVVRSPSNYR